MSNVTYEQFHAWIKKAEVEAAENPSGYKRKVGLFASLGYVFVFALIALTLASLAGLAYWAVTKESSGGNLGIAKLGFVVAIFGWLVITALWVKLDPPQGRRVSPEDFPELFNDIHMLRDKLDALPIHEVILTPDLNAFVAQTPRLGVLGWHRNTLAIGLELMLVLDREEMRAVLAHELGHLSGNHSRFAGWIYRVRRTWSNLMVKFQEQGAWGGFVIEKFFNWYVPRFDAYSFALRRLNEYEADATSAELTTADAAARALVKINVFGGYLNQTYWNTLFKLADTAPQPTRMAYAGFADQLERLDLPVDLLEALRENAMARETGYEDTHPALVDRLGALDRAGFRLDYDALDFTRSSAHELLGDRFDTVIAEFDAEWWAGAQDRWQAQFETVQSEKRELSELQARDPETLSDDELWALGSRAAKYIDAATALPYFQAYQTRLPGDMDAALVVGRLLAKTGDDACLIEWAKIPREHGHFVQSHDEAAAFLDQAGRTDEAKAWRAKADSRHEEVQQIKSDHAGVSVDDTLAAPDITEANMAYLVERLKSFRFVKAAWLAQKVTSQPGQMPIYVIAWQGKLSLSSAHSDSDEMRHQSIMNALADAHVKDDPMHLFASMYAPFAKGLAAHVKRDGVQIV